MRWKSEIKTLAKGIRLAIFDVDGVLTDGGLYFTDDGREIKKFNVKDGLGITWLIEFGIEVAVITGRNSRIVAERMRSLGVNHVYQGRLNKLETYENLKLALNLSDDDILYMGDDLIDACVMKRCALPITVKDAHPVAKQHALVVLDECGGQGAARVVCDLLLTEQGHMEKILQKYD